ncbi:MAG: FAD-dependent oxidoreductase [Phycisphaerales bacterium]
MNIAVIGAGISGLVCTYLLSRDHNVTLFEREPRLGGHTHTVTIAHEGRQVAVDTGFIVFNRRNYPQFCKLLERLGVPTRPTTMSFSVRDESFEFGGASLRGVIGSWTNLMRPRWWRVIAGVKSLGHVGKETLSTMGDHQVIGDLYDSRQFSRTFLDNYLVPMAASIWSAPRDALMEFPATFLLRFFDNHGMLDLRERPAWRTIRGGSRAYIDAIMDSVKCATRIGQAVTSVTRLPDAVSVATDGGQDYFDEVIFATHSNQTLRLLTDATHEEREILGAMPYQANHAVLHTDDSVLPRRRHCWAAWNYRIDGDSSRPVTVTYNMSILQGLGTRTPLCVTLNDPDAIDPACVLASFNYDHPLYTLEGDRARTRWAQISSRERRTHFCGAYWGNGFHEDGVVSALRVCRAFGVEL